MSFHILGRTFHLCSTEATIWDSWQQDLNQHRKRGQWVTRCRTCLAPSGQRLLKKERWGMERERGTKLKGRKEQSSSISRATRGYGRRTESSRRDSLKACSCWGCPSAGLCCGTILVCFSPCYNFLNPGQFRAWIGSEMKRWSPFTLSHPTM